MAKRAMFGPMNCSTMSSNRSSATRCTQKASVATEFIAKLFRPQFWMVLNEPLDVVRSLTDEIGVYDVPKDRIALGDVGLRWRS